MNYRLIPNELRPIAEKVHAQQRISVADALTLFLSNDLNALGMIANVVREHKNGNYATYIHNRYINYSNICILSCQFCAFAAKKRDAHAFEYAIDEIVRVVSDALRLGVTEVHMVGGLHPSLKKEWYLDLLRRLRALDPNLHCDRSPPSGPTDLSNANSRNAGNTAGSGARLDHRRWRGDFRSGRTRSNLPRQRNGR